MIKKQGITLIAATVTIIVMLIIAGVVTISTNSAINYSKISAWANEIKYVQDLVDETMVSSTILPYTEETVTIILTEMTEDTKTQFEGETIESNAVKLNILDLGALKITNTIYGNEKTANDVYAYSTVTKKVYYVQGIKASGKEYYTLTDSLKNEFELPVAVTQLSNVVFVPNVIGYTNTPITVTVKVPIKFTDITVTTSDANVVVGNQKTVEDIYEYEVNTGNYGGNYEITVKYTRGTQTYTTKYTVNTYDVTAPVITGIEYDNIVYNETDNSIIDYLSNITATDASGIKLFKYTLGTIVQEDAKEYFSKNGNNIIDGKINLDRTNTIYTVYAEDNAGNYTVTTFDKMYLMPEDWTTSVSYIHAHVPIPKGFVVSPYYDENKVNGGLVIYELTETEIAQNATTLPSAEDQFTSWTERNQFVWIPVDDFKNFKRQLYGQEGNISNELGATDTYWEVILDEFNLPDVEENKKYSNFITIETPENGITNTLDEAVAMYSSVKKYGGFYIARYEAGIEDQRTTGAIELVKGNEVYFVMGKKPYNRIPWTSNDSTSEDMNGAVEVARSIYPVLEVNSKYKVASTLVYGVQWDATREWLVSNILDGSIDSGNRYISVIKSWEDLNRGSKYSPDSGNTYYDVTEEYSKDNSTEHMLTTGALKKARVNNIYDMAGNLWELTMEGYSTNRVGRGGACNAGGNTPMSYRYSFSIPATSWYGIGFRIALYIK